jgi:hypothetical protein
VKRLVLPHGVWRLTATAGRVMLPVPLATMLRRRAIGPS